MRQLTILGLTLLSAFSVVACGPSPEQAPSVSAPSPKLPQSTFNQDTPTTKAKMQTITSTTSDGTLLTADLYAIGDTSAPLLLLFHQAGASRGEYRKIAPKLNQLGYNCLALDARSGQGGGADWSNVENATAKLFPEVQDYMAAKPDLEHCFAWAQELGFRGKIAIWGSSYSAALALVIAGEGQFKPDLVLAFSPGEYLSVDPEIVAKSLAKISVPTFITGPKDEEASNLKPLEAVAPKQVEFFVQSPGIHGSRALYLAPDAEKTWGQVRAFLAKYLPTEVKS